MVVVVSTTLSFTTVLYLEDQAYVREAVVELLTTDTCNVIECSTLAQARDFLATQRIDLLISDVNLPDGSGMELIKEVGAYASGLPIIVCSGHDLGKNPQITGPNVHILRKPFDMEELEALIAKLTAA